MHISEVPVACPWTEKKVITCNHLHFMIPDVIGATHLRILPRRTPEKWMEMAMVLMQMSNSVL